LVAVNALDYLFVHVATPYFFTYMYHTE